MAKTKTKIRPALKGDRSAERAPLLMEEPLSVRGQWIGWSVWGSFALIGFCFGVWVGTSKSGAQVETVQSTPSPTLAQTPPSPLVEPTKTNVVPAPKPPEPKKVEPRVEPMVTPEPKKVEPTPEPTPEPKKMEPEPKKVEPPKDVAQVSLKADLMPMFRTKCLNCHGATSVKGGLDMRTLEAMIKGGKQNGAGVKSGDFKASSIWFRVDDDSMPEDGTPLTPAEKKLIRDWILGGLKP